MKLLQSDHDTLVKQQRARDLPLQKYRDSSKHLLTNMANGSQPMSFRDMINTDSSMTQPKPTQSSDSVNKHALSQHSLNIEEAELNVKFLHSTDLFTEDHRSP